MDEKIKIIKDIEKYIAFWFVTQEVITNCKAEVEEEIKERKRVYATALYNAGYRKKSDTAREILTELKTIIISYLEEYMENGSEEAPKYFENLCKKYGVDLGGVKQ